MTLELTLLTWTLVLALVQVAWPATLSTLQMGSAWGFSARDQPPERTQLNARLLRAQHNLFETLPLFVAAVLIAQVAGRNSQLTAWGCELFLAARILYVPLYAFGVVVLRTVVWLASIVGLVMIIVAILS